MRKSANILTVLGLLALAYWLAVELQGRVYQWTEAKRIAEISPPEAKPLPEGRDREHRPHPPAGSPVALLVIPRLGLSTVVLEGADERQLRLGLGHIRETTLPGEGSIVGVAGHRDTFFRPLRLIRPDDVIKMIIHDREFRYRVTWTEIVSPEDVRVLLPTGHETLTLVTCYPFDFIGSAPRRFIVHADCANCTKTSS